MQSVRHIVGVALLLIAPQLWGQRGYTMRYEATGTGGRISFELQSWRLRDVQAGNARYQTIDMPSAQLTERKGWAELPYVSTSVAVSDAAHITTRLVSTDYYDIDLRHPMLPSRGTIYRSQNPDTIPYVTALEALVCPRYPEAEHVLDTPFVLRDVRGVRVCFYPFAYNAVEQRLRVFRRITVEVVERSSPRAMNAIVRRAAAHRLTQSNGLYRQMFLNHTALPATREPLPVANEYGDILVITTPRDTAGIAPYIEWKRQKGFGVQRVVVPRGTHVGQTVRDAFAANPDIMFVQLVGDWEDVKNGTEGSAPADPSLGCVVGDDYYPDIAVGRFSCTNAQELAAQVNKSINYERSPDVSAQNEWYSTAISIASNEGGLNGDNGESDIAHSNVIWDHKLRPDGYQRRLRFHQGQDDCLPARLHAAIEEGASIMNYTGHGYSHSFVTTGYTTTNVRKLTNGHKLPFIIATACLVGAYDLGNNFAEAWLRQSNGGAVATFMSSINQPWAPPMRGQDYFNDLLTGGYDYDHNPGSGINTEERRTLLGSIHINGLSLMLRDYGGVGRSTAQTWVVFGDAALQVRTAPPKTLAASSMYALCGIAFSTEFTAEGLPADNIQVCLSQNGRYVSGFTDADGRITLPTDGFEVGKALLVATGFNTTTIYQEIDVLPIDGPYVKCVQMELNHDGLLLSGRPSLLQLKLQNIGLEASAASTVRLSSANPLVMVEGEANIEALAPGANCLLDSFALRTSPALPDGQHLHIDVEVVSAERTWTSTISLEAHKPKLVYQRASWNELLGADNQVVVNVDVLNAGSYEATDVQVELSTHSPLVLGLPPIQRVSSIAPNSTGRVAFVVDIAPECTSDDAIPFEVSIVPGNVPGEEAKGRFVLSNTCKVELTLYGNSEYKDGWHGNMLRITDVNGLDTSITMASGYMQTHVLELPIGAAICVEFVELGRYAAEQSFRVAYAEGAQIAHVSNVRGAAVRFVCSCTCGGGLPPSPPTGLSVSAERDASTDAYTASLKWEPMPDALCYNVYKNGKILAISILDTIYVDGGLLPGGQFAYTVTAVACMGESAPSASVSASTKDCRAPSNLSYRYRYLNSIDRHEVSLTWQTSQMPGIRYAVYRNDTLLASGIGEAQYKDPTAYAGPLRYSVQSLCDDGPNGPMSSALLVHLRPCTPPSNLQAAVERHPHLGRPVVRLVWEAAPGQVFRVLRDDNHVVAQGILEPTFVDTSVNFGQHYRYKVKAICGVVGSSAIDDNSLSLVSNVVGVEVTEPLGLSARSVAGLRAYPNPAHGELRVEADGPLGCVSLYSLVGVRMREQRLGSGQRSVIDVSGLPPGIYLLMAHTIDGRCACIRVAVE